METNRSANTNHEYKYNNILNSHTVLHTISYVCNVEKRIVFSKDINGNYMCFVTMIKNQSYSTRIVKTT